MISAPYRPPHRLNRRRALLQLVASLSLLTASAASIPAALLALDAPCGIGKAYVRMWEQVGQEGDSVVLCTNKTNLALVGNNNRDCDDGPLNPNGSGPGDNVVWANCPGSLYVFGHNACFYTYIGYTENRLTVYARPGPTQVSLSGIWNNNLESFRWC